MTTTNQVINNFKMYIITKNIEICLLEIFHVVEYVAFILKILYTFRKPKICLSLLVFTEEIFTFVIILKMTGSYEHKRTVYNIFQKLVFIAIKYYANDHSDFQP